MDNHSLQDAISQYCATLLRNKRPVLVTIAVILILTFTVAFTLPSIYRSTARILVEDYKITKALEPATVVSYGEQRIRGLAQLLSSEQNLRNIVEKIKWYRQRQEEIGYEDTIDGLQNNIHLRMQSAQIIGADIHKPEAISIVFDVTAEGRNADAVQRLADKLSELILQKKLIRVDRENVNKSSFLNNEINTLEEKLRRLNNELIRLENYPSENLTTLSAIEMSTNEDLEAKIRNIDRNYQLLRRQKDSIKLKIAGLKRDSQRLSANKDRIDPNRRLWQLQAKYLGLSSVYSQKHPELVKLESEINALQSKLSDFSNTVDFDYEHSRLLEELARYRENYTDKYPKVVQLKSMISRLESLSSQPNLVQTATANGKSVHDSIQDLKKAQNVIELQLIELLNRRKELNDKRLQIEEIHNNDAIAIQDYSRVKQEYEKTLAQRDLRKDQLMDWQAQQRQYEKSERFSLVDPPRLPATPSRPNRPLLLMLAIIFAIIGGLVIAAIFDAFDDTIHGSDMVAQLFGSNPLANIPLLNTHANSTTN